VKAERGRVGPCSSCLEEDFAMVDKKARTKGDKDLAPAELGHLIGILMMC
jgi:hypothetical protein